MSYIFKELLPSILENDQDVLGDQDTDTAYPAFLVNRALSYHLDMIHFANAMNQYPAMDRRMQYDFLRTVAEKHRRPYTGKWGKKDETNKFLEIVKLTYKLSDEKAAAIVRVLTTEQLQKHLDDFDVGGQV